MNPYQPPPPTDPPRDWSRWSAGRLRAVWDTVLVVLFGDKE